MCPLWKKHVISNLGFLPIVVEIALSVVTVVAIGNSGQTVGKEEKTKKEVIL